nr:auxilin-like protein [Tanacetum cinerariifolium]
MVRDVLFDVCRHAGISAKKEPVNFLTDQLDGRSTLRPGDILIFGWVGGKHAYVDLNGVSPLVDLSSRGFTTGQAALKAISCKVTKHEKACIENQHLRKILRVCLAKWAKAGAGAEARAGAGARAYIISRN